MAKPKPPREPEIDINNAYAYAFKSCHPERVINLLYLIVLIAHNMANFGRVGTVQANCVNFSQFRDCSHIAYARSPD
jgi:hypothetical protein